MNILVTSILFFIFSFPAIGYTLDIKAFPESIRAGSVLTMTDDVHVWSPDNMFEQVNGEAELLIRYGALSLTFVSYENDTGDYVSVDLLDLGEPINAYGLYRLYSGCDGEELKIHGATVLVDEYTHYAYMGRYFLRINLDISDNAKSGSVVVEDFLKHFSEHVPVPSPLPAALEIIKGLARNPCDVNYHPEQIDYDLDTGPGYSWVGRDGATYAAAVLDSREDAALRFKSLQEKGVVNAVMLGNCILWKTADEGEPTVYMKEAIKQIVDRL